MKSEAFIVTVTPEYVPDQSDPDNHLHYFAYTVRIENRGTEPGQLISRHWIITDGEQRQQEVRGLGVVGKQPLIQPGQHFEYASACPLPTPVGTMKGSYQFVGENGKTFEVAIPEFILAMPRVLH